MFEFLRLLAKWADRKAGEAAELEIEAALGEGWVLGLSEAQVVGLRYRIEAFILDVVWPGGEGELRRGSFAWWPRP